MKTILFFLFVLISVVSAQPYPYWIRDTQFNAAGTTVVNRQQPYPATGQRGIMVYNPDASPEPKAIVTSLGTDFEWTPGTPSILSLSSDVWDVIDGNSDEIQDLWTAVGSLTASSFSGNYNDLTNKPTIPTVPTLVSEFTNDSGYLTSVSWSMITGKPTLFSGDYNDLDNLPALFDGDYDNLTNKPDIPEAQVNSDWNATSGIAQILNKPTLFSGVYDDLTGKPTLFSGDYGDLTNKPTIPNAQVQTDWNAVSGIGAILNKPSEFNPAAHNQAWSTITSTPTTLSGYGIADAYPLSGNPSAFINQTQARSTVSLTTTGTGAATYNSATGVLNIPTPTAPNIQRIRVQTDANGNYTWTYPVAYETGVVPVISALTESSSSTIPQGVQIVGVPTNTSCTFKVINLPSTSVLSIVVLGAPTGSQAYLHLTAMAP